MQSSAAAIVPNQSFASRWLVESESCLSNILFFWSTGPLSPFALHPFTSLHPTHLSVSLSKWKHVLLLLCGRRPRRRPLCIPPRRRHHLARPLPPCPRQRASPACHFSHRLLLPSKCQLQLGPLLLDKQRKGEYREEETSSRGWNQHCSWETRTSRAVQGKVLISHYFQFSLCSKQPYKRWVWKKYDDNTLSSPFFYDFSGRKGCGLGLLQ